MALYSLGAYKKVTTSAASLRVSSFSASGMNRYLPLGSLASMP